MASPAVEVHDEIVRHRIALSRYSTTLVRKVMAQLNRLDADLVARIQDADPTGAGRARLEVLLNSIRAVHAEAWGLVKLRLNGDLGELAAAEAAFAEKVVRFAARSVGVDVFGPAPALAQIMGAVQARPFQGRFLRDWLDGTEAAAAARVRDTIRQGFIEGRPTQEIVRILRGTRANRFTDGVIQISRRGAETMVRTAVTHTSSVAHEEVYRANADVIEGLIWTSTLDSRTSDVCISRSEQVYPIDKGPRPPAHPNCRSTMRPKVADIPGVAPMKTESYSDWLKRQPVKVQDEILGPKKAALFRTGGLPITKFTDDAGRSLTLDELKKRDAEAFEAAGLNNPMKPPRGAPQDAIALFLADPAAQRSLLDRLFGSAGATDRHLEVVREAAEEGGWDAQEHDLGAIRFYTGHGYAEINRRMRESGGTLEDRQFTAMASRGVDDMPDERHTVWRKPATQMHHADRVWAKAVVGEDMDLGNQLQSFTREKSFAAAWGQGDVLYEIEKPVGAAYIEDISLNPGEEEVLFRLGLRYRVVGKREEEVNGRLMRIIELEVVE